MLISNHHLLMDGWSAPILVRELLEVYAQHGSAASLPRVTPYRDYLTFIARQDRAAGLAAWREALTGLEEGTRLAPRQAGREPLAPEQIVLSLDPALSALLNRAAREQALTLNTVMQTAWGILLGRLSGRDDVVFGVTVAGSAGGACRRRAHGGAVHQHAAAAAAAAAGAAAVGAAAADPGQPVAADGASASRPGRDPAGGRGGRSVRHAVGVRELSGRPRRTCSSRTGDSGPRPEARPGRGPRCDALSAGADRAAGRDAAIAARLSARPVRAGGRGGARRPPDPAAGGRGCGPGPRARQRWRSWSARSATPSCGAGTTPRARFRPRPCRRCLPRRLCARRMRSRWCSRTVRSATPRSTPTPTGWRIICKAWGSAPRPWSGCASSARPRW